MANAQTPNIWARNYYIKTNKCESCHYVYCTITMISKYYNHHKKLENYINPHSPLRITPCNNVLFISSGKLIDRSIKIMLINGSAVCETYLELLNM